MTVYEDALKLHELHHGKLSIEPKVPCETPEDLTLAYTPGVACLLYTSVPRLIRKSAAKASYNPPFEVFKIKLSGNVSIFLSSNIAFFSSKS